MRDLLTFLGESPSRFHAVENLRQTLEQEGYTRLSECGTWDLAVGGKYYVTRNGSALMAFRIPRKDFTGFMMSASHSDYPAFRVKENAELTGPEKYLRLNTERYGGQLLSTWLDRPLTVAGRVLVEEKGAFRKLVAEAAGCKAEDILGTDLFLCLRQKPLVWGANGEFVSAAGLDDLQCAYGCFKGFMEAKESSSVPVYVLFDNEEVGSQTKQGAGGTFLADLVDRVCAAMGRDKASAVACSFMVSADNAHAVHPNHPEFADATHRPAMNAGPVIKFGVRYATDGASQAIFTALCKKAGVPVQHFANRSDMAGGGTLGCISLGQLSVNTVDIGLPQLAMHSCFETAGSKDTEYLVKAMAEVYSASFREDHGLFTLA